MVKLAEFRKNLAAYLSDKMSVVAPNLSALIGDTVAARLISKVGRIKLVPDFVSITAVCFCVADLSSVIV